MSDVRPPSGKTILIARNVSDGSRGGNVAPPIELNLPRDARTGKLNSYAALGGADDVELFEKFLTSQSQRGAVVNPAAVRGALNAKASARRRSLSFANLNLADGASVPTATATSNNNNNNNISPTNNTTTGSSSAGAKQMTEQERIEVEMDAKQKRELAVRYRKWLKTLTIQERVAHQRQQNVLRKWQQVNKQWEEFKLRTSKRLGKHPTNLVMSRASTYRTQVEEHEAIERAIPLTDKIGDDIWLISLRNEGTRYVAVGNIFSGLFCPIRENRRCMPSQLIRRPLEADLMASSNHVSRRNSVGVLDKKKRRIKKQLEKLYPHQIDIADSVALKVDTVDLFEWAANRGSKASCDSRDQSESIESQEPPSSGHELQSVEEEILTSRTTTSHTPSSPRVQGPHLRVSTLETFNANVTTNATFSELVSLSFFTTVQTLQQRDVVAENDGSVALQFRWIADHSSAPEQKSHVSEWFGVLLPGERKTFQFSYVSLVCGTFLETWTLLLDPPVKDLAAKETYPCVQIHATSVDHRDIAIGIRKKSLRNRVGDATKSFMAQQLVNGLVNNVLTTYQPEEEVGEEVDYKHFEPSFRDVYYSQSLQRSAAQLYERSLDLLRATTKEPVAPPAEDPKAVEPPVIIAGIAVKWDGNLASLEAITKAADDMKSKSESATASEAHAKEEDNDEEEDGEGADGDGDSEEGNTARKKDKLESVTMPPLVLSLEQEFRMLRCVGVFAPYDSSFLKRQIAQTMSTYCSEVPVVKDVVSESPQTESEPDGPDTPTVESRMDKLFCRAIDEAMEQEQTQQLKLQTVRRKMQRLWLPNKLTIEPLSRISDVERINVVAFVDLDLAEWYVPVNDKWMLDPALIKDEPNWVPHKVQTVIKLLESIQQRTKAAQQIILLSDLSDPPKPKGTNAKEFSSAIKKELSLRQVAILLERALKISNHPSESIEFVASLDDLKEKTRPKPTPEAGAKVAPGADADKPRIILMEHLLRIFKPLASAGDADRPSSSNRPHTPGVSSSAAASTSSTPKKGTPSAPEPTAKAKAGGAHHASGKKSTVDKAQHKTAAAPAQAPVPTPVPIPETSPAEPPAQPLTRPQTSSANRGPEQISISTEESKRFGSLLSPWCHVLIADTFSPYWCPDLLRLVEPVARPSLPLPRGPRVLGPTMETSLAAWQTVVTGRAAAVVGGKKLEHKFRFLDGLVELVDSIYFVGEIALSMCRLLAVNKKKSGALPFDETLLLVALRKLRQKAQRRNVRLFLPFDWIVGEIALSTKSEELSSRVAPADSNDDDNEDDEDEKELVKKTALTDREELAARCNAASYEAERVHVRLPSAAGDMTWINMDIIDSDRLSQIEVVEWSKRNVLQTAMDSVHEASTKKGFHHRMAWTRHAFDVGPLSMNALVKSLEQQRFDVVVWCGVPGAVEFVEFSEATKTLLSGLKRLHDNHKVSQVLVAGKTTAEWVCHLQQHELKQSLPLNEQLLARATCKNAPVLKDWISSLPHAALTSLSEHSDEPLDLV